MLLATRSVVSVEVATEIRVVVGTGTPSGSVSSLLRDLFHVNLGMTYGIFDCFRPLSGLFPNPDLFYYAGTLRDHWLFCKFFNFDDLLITGSQNPYRWQRDLPAACPPERDHPGD
jgi:hypothetical protein